VANSEEKLRGVFLFSSIFMFRVSGAFDDEGAADLVGWRFIKEIGFAAGAR
jgi:hypothetical protein